MQQLPLRDGAPYDFQKDDEDTVGWDGAPDSRVANSTLGDTQFEWDVSAEGSVRLIV